MMRSSYTEGIPPQAFLMALCDVTGSAVLLWQDISNMVASCKGGTASQKNFIYLLLSNLLAYY